MPYRKIGKFAFGVAAGLASPETKWPIVIEARNRTSIGTSPPSLWSAIAFNPAEAMQPQELQSESPPNWQG